MMNGGMLDSKDNYTGAETHRVLTAKDAVLDGEDR